MTNIIHQSDGLIVTDWGEYFLAQLLKNLPRRSDTDIESILLKEFETHPRPCVVNCFRLEGFDLHEIRLFVQLKLKISKLSFLGNPRFIGSLNDQGVSTALPSSATLKQALSAQGIAYKPKIDAAFINPFLDGAIQVLSSQLRAAVSSGKPFVLKDSIASDVTGMIPISSPIFSGSLSLEFPKNSFLAIVSCILGEVFTTLGPDNDSFAAELVSMVYGKAKAKLNESGYTLLPGLPSIVRGLVPIAQPGRQSIGIGIPLETVLGPLTLVLRIEN